MKQIVIAILLLEGIAHAQVPIDLDLPEPLRPRGGEDFPFYCVSSSDELRGFSLRSSWLSLSGYVVDITPQFSRAITIPVTIKHDKKKKLLSIKGKTKDGLVHQHFNGQIDLGENGQSKAELIPMFSDRPPILTKAFVKMFCERDD